MDEMNDKDIVNEVESSERQAGYKAKNKLKDMMKNGGKKIIKSVFSKKVLAILAIVIAVVIFVVVFFGGAAYVLGEIKEQGTNKAKAKAVEISYAGDTPITGVDEDTEEEVNKVIIKPNDSKNGYEITYDDSDDNLFNIGKKIEQETSISASKFSDFELGVLGSLMDNGANLEYYTEEQLHCFPAFIKAEACTQFLDLRPNIDANNYQPAELKDLSENEVPGVVLVQRTNTQDNNPITLTYVSEKEFDKKLEGNSESEKNWLMKHFTLNDKGELKIATWTMQEVTVDNPQNYPEHLPDEEKEKSTGKVYFFNTIEMPYSDYIKEYTMPFEFLVQLLVYTEDTDFCMELVEDYIIKSKIIINLQEEETDTHITDVRNYTVYSKDEKRIDYKISPIADIESGNDLKTLLRNGNPNVDDKGKECTNYYNPNLTTVTITRDYVDTSYSWEVTEADTWLIHMTKTYLSPEEKLIQDTTESIEDIPEEYTVIDEQTSTDTDKNANDGNVKQFKEEREEYYKSLITIPKVKLDLGTKYIWDALTQQFVEIPGNNKISITPEDKIQSPWTSKEYEANESLPSTINVTTKANGDLPQITFPFNRNNNSYITEYTKDKIAECVITKLNIKKFERIDLQGTITTKITKWEADQNPVTENHIYATKDGQPGRGEVNGDNFEKFLIAYDNNEEARNQINSISYWLFEAMEENEKTVELVDYIKWILYLYDGTNYGVTEAPDISIFESEKFTSSLFTEGSLVVKTDATGALQELTKDEVEKVIKKRFSGQAKDNLLSSLDAFMYIQETYHVNAIFAIAVTQKECSCGTNLQIGGYNWYSIKGSSGWKKYSSYDEATRDFGNLIANSNYYFKAGNYTVDSIGNVYCVPPEGWIKSVSQYIKEMYESIGITVISGGGNEIQQKVVEVAKDSSKYGIPAISGYCQAWVSDVYLAAGANKARASACCAVHAGAKWGVSTDWSQIQVGASVYGYASQTYGHVGIYIGDGIVAHNRGGVKYDSLEDWIKIYKGVCWGWNGGTDLTGGLYPCKTGLMKPSH